MEAEEAKERAHKAELAAKDAELAAQGKVCFADWLVGMGWMLDGSWGSSIAKRWGCSFVHRSHAWNYLGCYKTLQEALEDLNEGLADGLFRRLRKALLLVIHSSVTCMKKNYQPNSRTFVRVLQHLLHCASHALMQLPG